MGRAGARIVAAAGLAGLLGAGAFLLWGPGGDPATPGPDVRAPAAEPRDFARTEAHRGDPQPPAPLAPLAAGEPAGARPWPRALRGTTPSGGLRTDAAGHFVPGPEALRFFDYFLSASNEESPEELAQRIRTAIRERLAPPADAEAEAFLATYLDYLAAGDEEFRVPGLAGSGDLERRLQWVRELRREHFGPELAERLFGEEEETVRIHLERRRIRAAEDLDPDERRARLEALEERYPESVREARARAVLPLRHAREEAALREQGASAQEIDALRAERFGPEAARRLRALDEERARWQARWQAYSARRRALAAEIDDADALAAATGALRDELFEAHELHRVEVLDRRLREDPVER
ncbi:MAG: lipase secretion chaperone [Myxococcota bacterium]